MAIYGSGFDAVIKNALEMWYDEWYDYNVKRPKYEL